MLTLGQITDESIRQTNEIIRAVQSSTRVGEGARKAITVAGDVLYGYPLEAPSKNVYPVEDRVRRRIPRWVNPKGGAVAHWKVVTSINANNVEGAVSEGNLNSEVTLTDSDKNVTYKTLDMVNSFTDEARAAGRAFEDIPAKTMLTALQNLMIEEDIYDIGGNITAVGAPTGLTGTGATTTGGGLTSGTTYYYAVSALTLQGYLKTSTGRAAGVDAPNESTGATFSGAPGGSFNSEALTWTDVKGAVAYNVFVGTTATVHYLATATVNAYTALTSTQTSANVPNVADQTGNTKTFDGVLAQAVVSGANCYYKTLDNAKLTTDGGGGILELENMLKSMFKTARIGPTVVLVGADVASEMKNIIMANGGTPIVRIDVTEEGERRMSAGYALADYWSPYMAQNIEILVSQHMPPGLMLAIAETLPYPNNETPNNLEMELQYDYFGEEMAKTSRKQVYSVSMYGALKLYFPPGVGVIKNIQ